jgi:glutamyl-queuosine tRNA(Asp) synthetase
MTDSAAPSIRSAGQTAAQTVGRFAPSPTGVLHLGNLRTALASWLSAKSRGGRWAVRVEDVDAARCRRDLADEQLRDLSRIGLESDAPVVWQSERGGFYRAALEQLAERGRLYRCRCTRKDLALLASAPHADDGLRAYPGICRAEKVGGFMPEALRAELPPGAVEWADLLLGPQADDPANLTGDPVLYRRDGCFAYHLAVVVDDGEQGVTEVVRGADLRGVTATQIRLQELLGYARPAYAHLGLVTAPDGARLGKRGGAPGLAALGQRGASPAEVVGWLGWSLGCLERPAACRAAELVEGFEWSKVPAGPVAAPEGWG